ncbi:unnamed protein product [Arctia plantaginis]|uniref:Uncharacterized protein n=1 Tax=Arctia plantaginis TaxID=874455 RepID=A0A8S1AHF4_ARCPL|nr:unnamed protein product [Arctia plantaginis]CAB3244638.1 unnamed protein product [Arctia plantaginis]
MAITSYDITCEKKKFKKYETRSPYLNNENKVQLLSRVSEKRSVKKKTLDYVSSFPLAANIYKANSDEFKLKRGNRKIKKSVLTLPNQPTPSPQICTVSDMNDSEYCSQSNGNNNKPRIKKRSGIKNVRKSRVKNKEFGFYDGDERFCSQFDVNLDSSSTEMMKNFKGDCRRSSNIVMQKRSKALCLPKDIDMKPHDVWAVLRNLNRFPFRPSPPMSEESIIGTKKKKAQNKRINKDTRVFETKEFAYISSYKVDNNSQSMSQSSSFDRVTVIDKQDQFSNMCQHFEDTFLETRTSKDVSKNRLNIKNKLKKRFTKKKSLCPAVPNANNLECVPKIPNALILVSENDQEYDKNTSSSIEDDVNSSLTNIDNRNQSTVECSLVPAKESFVISDNSGSSKAELSISDISKMKGKIICNRAPQVKEISRVNFGKTCESLSQVSNIRSDLQQRKPRLVTTMPSACMMPKLTHTDIKKRIAALRFPVVILGREQISSSVEVNDYDPPQFNGLDEHIWPYMVNWHHKDQNENKGIMAKEVEVSDYVGQKNRKSDICHPNKATMGNNEIVMNNKPKYSNNGVLTKYKNETKKIPPCTETNTKRQQNKNQESITLLKDKMLNFLFQKKTGNVVTENCNNIKLLINNKPVEQLEQQIISKSVRKFDAYTETEIKKTMPHKYYEGQCVTRERKSRVKFLQTKTHQTGFEYPWAKAKRVNDFIESVIRKIRTGVYYSKDLKYVNPNSDSNRATDMAMQTDHEDLDHIDISPKVTVMKKPTYKSIPGFDSSLPGLEIKTLNMNQIAVKHCVTNIMVQFDVTDNISTAVNSKALPIMPVDVTESHTRIFKCKTTIVNAMLPAELCSILPKLMKLIDSDVKSVRPAFGPALINKNQSHLSPISELSTRPCCESNTVPIITTKPLQITVSPLHHLAHAVKPYISGMFSSRNGITKGTKKLNPVVKYNPALLRETLPKSYTIIDILTYGIRLPLFKEVNIENQSKRELPVGLQKQCPTCTALDLYTTNNKRLVPAFKPFKFEDAITEILIKIQVSRLNVSTYIPKALSFSKIRYLNITSLNNNGSNSNVSVITNNLNMNNLFSQDKKYVLVQNDTSEKRLEYIKPSTKYGSKIKDLKSVTELKVNIKNKRKGFYRLYRKCKSATIIPTEKYVSTPLHKIQNLDDFFQVLGSKKILASVFDGNAEKKILSSVVEMKNWMTDINPKQALLLLLLMNKKDTPNLVRFRPILLQAIAVNRITRATELDMEIEVIERENFNKFREYEGISYLPESVENHDHLLEELYWIAKTTASDYQKPFDESSERLLKSLLEKRKKLNPSYLRVMARYVGLGLLKQSTKK